MRAFVGVAAVVAVAGFALLAPVPGAAQDYSYSYGYQAYQAERDGGREDWGNAPYNAYNSWDGYARSHRGYWERPSDRYRGSCGGYRCYRGAYSGYAGYGYGYGGGYGADGAWYYPGYGYGGANTPSPAFPASGYGSGQGYGGRDPQRSQWCASRYRSYDWRSGTFVGYDGWRHYCG